jgi:hypothetical protein
VNIGATLGPERELDMPPAERKIVVEVGDSLGALIVFAVVVAAAVAVVALLT